ncbi:CarD family transcriptional regulator [Aureimonas sp. Leaf454]|uniref:Crp/Fnr family transcriptional regulator n=1 Tax=Aureimonas sp. Leaf454 TaxID=1736381 RepID=UPI0006F5C738|nr:Crp/Fnr family transcriptional regulator [Aureimonas sp. Leaf454]KQT50197.1 CarD family transcriptional regulator [Aureimonas sp. Leaf454]
MPIISQGSLRNGLLKALPAESFEGLRPHLELVDLPMGTIVTERNTPAPHVHFLETGLVSMITVSQDDGEQIEVGHIGWEGMTNFHLAHAVDRTSNRAFVQADATAWRLSSEIVQARLDADRSFRALVGRYIHTYEIQLAQSALANGRYNMHERLARWLLMCHDRLQSDQMQVTHESLSLMLGVRRSGVTTEIQILEGLHLIKARRGLVHLRDRAGLEEVAGGCYGLPEAEYERWFQIPLSHRSRHVA